MACNGPKNRLFGPRQVFKNMFFDRNVDLGGVAKMLILGGSHAVTEIGF